MAESGKWFEDVRSGLSLHVFLIRRGVREPGFETGWRRLPAPLIEIPEDGWWDLWLEGRLSPLIIKDHEVLVIPAGMPHRLCHSGSRPMATNVLFASFRWMSHLDLLSMAEIPISLPRSVGIELVPLIAEMTALLEKPDLENAIRVHELAFKSLGIVMGHSKRKNWRLPSLEMERVVKSLDTIKENLKSNLSCDALASKAALSPSRFRTVFKKTTGSAPKVYLRDLRLRQASSLLISSNLPIYAIADECGFHSSFYFCRHFVKHIGMTPSAFRKEFSGRQR
jgi:AraC-like DNA-binding protein